MLLDKLAFTENKYEELSVKISDPSIMANQKEWRKLCKEHADLEIIVTAYREYKKVLEDLEANKEMLEEESDKEMREMLSEEISMLKEQEAELEEAEEQEVEEQEVEEAEAEEIQYLKEMIVELNKGINNAQQFGDEVTVNAINNQILMYQKRLAQLNNN